MNKTESRVTKIENLLSVIRSEIPSTIGGLLVTDDGFIVASQFDNEIDYYEVGAALSSMLQQVRNFSKNIFDEQEQRVSLQSKTGDIQIFSLTDSTNLVIVSNSDSKPGLLLLRVKKIKNMLIDIILNKKS